MEPSHRSIHPNIPGVPWWTALLVAVTATAIGYSFDAGHKELTHVFAGFYIAGCVAAMLAVRQEGVFTAIIQPPLILFCAVPGAYWLFHGGKLGSIKDLLINCGYPLIERFPLMLGTAGGVLLIGLARWYFGTSRGPARVAEATGDAAGAEAGATSVVSGIVAKLQLLFGPDTGEDEDKPRRDRPARSSPNARRPARNGRTATRSGRAGSRNSRQPLDDTQDPERPRRRSSSAARDYDAAESRRSRRRPRPAEDPDLRGQPSREGHREPRTRRGPYERRTPTTGRSDGFGRWGEGYDPSEHVSRYEPHERYEPSYEPRRRRATPNGSGPTHHPISQVRYRGSSSTDEPGADGRSRSRTPRRPAAESWEYEG